MPLRQKFALYGIFVISYSTIIIGTLRSYSTYLIYFETYDVTWIAGGSFLYAILELHIGAMCANAPALEVFFKTSLALERVTKSIASRSSNSRSNGSKQECSNPAETSNMSVSKTSAWIPTIFLKSSHSKRTSGYISESNTNVTTDKHGSIVAMSVYGQSKYQQHECDSISRPFAPEYSDTLVSPGSRDYDVEIGIIRTHNRMNDISALLPIGPPPSPIWLRPIRSISPHPKQ
jgi:hypothetical protein